MQGEKLSYIELNDFWTYLRIAGCIASEILPAETPNFGPHLALQQEFEFAYMVYHLSRSVRKRAITVKCFLLINIFGVDKAFCVSFF